MSVAAALNSPNISLIPGSNFSILRVLELACNVWKPDTDRGRTLKQVFCNYVRASFDPATRAALCAALFPDGQDDQLETELSNAISFAAAEALQTIGNQIPGIGGDCLIMCNTGGAQANFDAGAVVNTVVNFAVSSYGGDGIDWGGLIAEGAEFALTQAVCCITGIAGDLAAKAAVASRRLNTGKIVAQLKSACNAVLVAEGQTPAGTGPVQGWGTPEPVVMPPVVEAPVFQTPVTPRPTPVGIFTPGVVKTPDLVVATPPPPPPRSGKNWLPLVVAFTGTAVTTILIMRRR
jgi:hypothetical protein